MNQRKYLFLAIAALSTLSCLRETGIEQLPVNATVVTRDNLESMLKGKDAMARTGDYLLRNNQIQLVFNGDLYSDARALYSPKNAGSLIDFSTLYESGANRTLTPRDDDFINQISQGVNMNRNNLVVYERIQISAPTEAEGSLILTGSIYDFDGSLAAQGASVDAQGRLLGCTVTTTYFLKDIDQLPNADTTSAERIINRPVTYAKVTTIVSNTGNATLPIYEVNDVVFLGKDTANVFVPYPDWGFQRPTTENPTAWPPFVHIQPRQINTTHYGFVSRTDALLKVREGYAADIDNDLLYVGKINVPQTGLPAGGAYTYVREMVADSEGSGGASSIPTSSFFLGLADLLIENQDANNIFAKLGRAQVGLHANDLRSQMEGEMTLEYTKESIKYYNGSAFVTLEPGRNYPIFGDSPVNVGSSSIPSYSLFLPGGKLAVRARGLNSVEFYRDQRPVVRRDAQGEPIKDAQGNIIIDYFDSIVEPKVPPSSATTVNMGGFEAIAPMEEIDFAVDDTQEATKRDLFCRLNFERTDSATPFELGEYPVDYQGKIFYVDRTAEVNSTQSAQLNLPKGVFDVLASRGPLHNVNIFAIDNLNTKPSGSTDPKFNRNFTIVLGTAMTLSNYLSADFDIRGTGDPFGMVADQQHMLLAYAEDLDVVFVANAHSQSLSDELFIAQGRSLGSFSKADEDKKIESWFDEVAYSRAQATIGKTRAWGDVGRFALLNLPPQEKVDFIETPLITEDPAVFYGQARAIGEGVLIHVTRPRAPKGVETGFLTAIAEREGLDADQPIPGNSPAYTRTAANGSGARWIDFDLLQILSSNRYDEFLLTRQDWFNLLNVGIFKPVTGGSTTTQTKDIPIGAVRTYVAVNQTQLRDNKLEEFWANAKAGRMFVSNGPIIEASINGTSYGQSTTATGTVNATVRLRAAGWVPVQELRVIMDGQVIHTETNLSNQILRFEGTIPITIPADGKKHWIVFEAGASLSQIETGVADTGTFGRVMPGHLPIAVTNPIFIN